MKTKTHRYIGMGWEATFHRPERNQRIPALINYQFDFNPPGPADTKMMQLLNSYVQWQLKPETEHLAEQAWEYFESMHQLQQWPDEDDL